MNNEILKYQIAIGLISGIGPVTAKNLIAYSGSVDGVFKETKQKLIKIPGIGEYGANKIIKNRTKALNRALEEIKFIEKHKIKTTFYLDKDYPELLKHCNDSPLMIYSRGIYDFANKKVISIVGTRDATHKGKENCENLIKDLKEAGHNPVIVSGLAYGIDICAHKAALKNGLQTVAVLGHGLQRIYPANHKNTAKEIINQGAVVTEFLSDSKFERQNFLQRNRIIAGMSVATIVVESAAKGGSLITAELANSYNREVFAFPGRVNDKYSAGCNKLIKQHKGYLIESYKDIEYILGWEKGKTPEVKQNVLFVELSDEEKNIVDVLRNTQNSTIDLICNKSKYTMGKVSSVLLDLEFKDIVKCLPGKVYELAVSITEN